MGLIPACLVIRGQNEKLDEGELIKMGRLSQHRIYDPGKGPGRWNQPF